MAHETADAAPPAGQPNEFGPPSPARRRFLNRLSLALSGVIGAVIGIPIVSFLLAPLFRRQVESWQAVGPVTGFQVGATSQVVIEDPSPLAWAGLASRNAAWLRRESDSEFRAFSVNCTHLGCPVRWLQDAGLFMCPCHGGVFYRDGRVAGGPPQEPLVEYPVRLRNSQVEVLAGASPIVRE